MTLRIRPIEMRFPKKHLSGHTGRTMSKSFEGLGCGFGPRRKGPRRDHSFFASAASVFVALVFLPHLNSMYDEYIGPIYTDCIPTR